MESFHFNNVKAEKDEAMRRYNRQKKLKNLLFLVEILAALALLSWSFYTYIPIVSETANDFLRQHVAVFSPSFHVFMIVNVLVVLIYVLSSQRPAEADLYEEYVTNTTTTVSNTVSDTKNNIPRRSVNAADDSREPEQPVVEKQIVFVHNAATSPVRQNTTPSLTVRDCEKKKRVDVSPRGAAVTENDKTYRRARSEHFEKERRRELRRSGTVVKREMVAVSNIEQERRSSAIDDLSSEDFRLTIETFIASKKKTLMRENTLDLKLERKECMAITLSACN